jgi:hypothetical protein
MSSFMDLTTAEKLPTKDYLLDCLLKSRIGTHHESNTEIYDEDVNIYLVNLLYEYMDPEYLHHIEKYLYKFDCEIAEQVSEHHDKIFNYFIYKTNADYYLLFLTLFGKLTSDHVPLLFRIPRENFAGRAQAYYAFAAEYNKEIHHKKTAVSDILIKLSRFFPVYVDILEYAKTNYFHFKSGFSDGEWFHLTKEANQKADHSLFKQKLDELLKLCLAYPKTQKTEDKEKIKLLAEELHAFDPTFHFDPEKVFSDAPSPFHQL